MKYLFLLLLLIPGCYYMDWGSGKTLNNASNEELRDAIGGGIIRKDDKDVKDRDSRKSKAVPKVN